MPKPAPVIRGTSDSETITGTNGNDVIRGMGGGDTIYGLGGNDELYGAAGTDYLYGGAGDDRMWGADDNDFLYGEAGNDTLFGGYGDNFLYGGDGNDTLWWNAPGHNQLWGEAGADTFTAGAWQWTNQQVGTVLIMDFQTGTDTLDLIRFDADERTAPEQIRGKNRPGNEAFTVVEATDGVTPGHLVITTGFDDQSRPITIVLGYTDTEAGADIVIQLLGQTETGGPIIGPQDIWL